MSKKSKPKSGPQYYRNAQSMLDGMTDTLTELKDKLEELKRDPVGFDAILRIHAAGIASAQVFATLALAEATAFAALDPQTQASLRDQVGTDWAALLKENRS